MSRRATPGLNLVNVISSKTFDVSSGMLHMSASQKASIVEGVGRDIDIGSYDIRAKSITVSAFSSSNLVSTALTSSKGILYTDESGTIASMDGVLEYDAVLGKVNVILVSCLAVSDGKL